MSSPLGRLALARGTLDRVVERRHDETWLRVAWANPGTRVLVVEDGRALVRFAAESGSAHAPALVLLEPKQVPAGERYLLGVDAEEVAYFVVSGPLPKIEGAQTADLRRVGAVLGDRDAGLLTQAIALANWHSTHPHCSRCGSRTNLAMAGHTRVCPADGSQHFPRVDPAVIMLIRDPRDRVLLARNPQWPQRRVSVLAGFVEPGESLEQAVAREVLEEVGLTVHDMRYLGSQPWPMPQSLMLGFFARAAGDQEIRVDAEEIETAHWYTRAELLAAVEQGEVLLPGQVSIARRLIETWYGGELPGDW